MFDVLEEICTTLPVDGTQALASLLLALFVAGLMGGFLHCSFMCGPFVMMQVSRRLENISVHEMSEWSRLKGAAILPYHFGRITTYMILGALAASAGHALSGIWRESAAILMLLAGIFFILSTFRGSSIKFFDGRIVAGIGQKLTKVIQPLSKKPYGWRGYILGLVLGLLPCGMLYGAIAASAAAGSVWSGIFAMGIFGLGTVPSLLAVGFFGNFIVGLTKKGGRIVAKASILIAGFWLCFVALNILI